MNQYSKRNSLLQIALFGGAFATTAALTLLTPLGSRAVRAQLQDSPKAIVDEVWQIVNRDYVDGSFNQVNWEATRTELLSQEYSSPEQAYAAVRVALAKLNDPYTRFLDPEQFEELTTQTSGEMSGVGMRLELNADTQKITVVEPIENSPAKKAGLQSGDQILQIDDRLTEGMKVEEAAQLIRGKEGTEVSLRVYRSTQGEFDVILKRARIELQAVQYHIRPEGGTDVGYIQLSEFSSHAAEQMRHAIEELSDRGVDAYVLDLRGNPGGLLYASIDIARMWLDSGEIVRTVDRNGGSQDFRANRSAIAQQPLAVLVDKNSASASEILSGALKDNRRATIIGTSTFGKALVQSVHSLSDGSGLTVTIAHYYTPNGTDISQLGITPDIAIDMSNEDKRRLAANPQLRGTSDDPCYARAVASLLAQVQSNPLAIQ
ncbi:MAG TPA: carboxyl-terminal processing protease CtpB [Vampirovibrionales bacterium]